MKEIVTLSNRNKVPFNFLLFRTCIGSLQLTLGVVSERLGAYELIRNYLSDDRINEALNLFASLDWNFEPNECYASLTVIISHLLREELSVIVEGSSDTLPWCYY